MGDGKGSATFVEKVYTVRKISRSRSDQRKSTNRSIEKIKKMMQGGSPNFEDVRQRNLLNILLAGCFMGAIVACLILAIGILVKAWKSTEAAYLLVFFSIFLIIIAGVFLVNRRPDILAI